MQNKFKGWKTVFSFTLKKTCTKSYYLVTFLIAAILAGLIICLCIFNAKSTVEDKDTDQKFSIKTVMIFDESKLPSCDYKTLLPLVSELNYKNTSFFTCEGKTLSENMKQTIEKGKGTVLIHITKVDEGYQIECLNTYDSTVSDDDCSALINDMKVCLLSNNIAQLDLSEKEIVTLLSPINTNYVTAGENRSRTVQAIQLVAPGIFGLLLYFMLLFYGQSISQNVATEKTSKLMETLLTSVHPYAMITGKVTAIFCSAIIQFLIWIGATIAGLFGGNAIAHAIYPTYQNTIIKLLDVIRDDLGNSALSLPSVVVALFIFCIGFLFYCILSSLAGAIASKPEQVANAQGLFVFPVLVSWMVTYFATLAENTSVLAVSRYIPFTIPFSVPVELMIGKISMVQGLISLTILTVFSVFFIMAAAKIYKGMILYQGEKFHFKTLIHMIKEK